MRKNGLRAVIVNPTFMVGPFDSKPGFGVIILAVYHERIPGCAVGGRNYVHVRDVAAGIVIAQSAGAVITDWQGAKIFPVDANSYQGGDFNVVAANKKVHGELLQLLKS